MIVKNALGIPIYVPEWNGHIPAGEDGENFVIETHKVHSAPSIRAALMKGYIVVKDHDANDGIEAAFAKISAKSRKPSPSTMLDDVVVRGQMLDYSGYAKVNRNLIRCLRSHGVSASADPVDLGRPQLMVDDVKNDVPLRPRCNGIVDINSVVPTYGGPGGGSMRVLYTTVESETLPKEVIASVRRYDQVWCVSDFCSNVMKNHGVDAKTLYPHVDGTIYCEKGPIHSFAQPLPSFKFLTIFGASSRKVGLNTVKAFLREFDSGDDVCFIVAHRDKRGEGGQKEFADSMSDLLFKSGKKNLPLVVRMPKSLSENALAKLYRSIDACVLAARGEGFCLPYAEAALCGRPSISPRFGGPLDFLDDDSAYLIDVEKMIIPKGSMNTVLWDETLMADVVSDDFIDRLAGGMRRCFEDSPKVRSKKACLAASKINEICSNESVANQFRKLVSS